MSREKIKKNFPKRALRTERGARLKSEQSVSAHVPYDILLDDHTLLTKDDFLIQTIKLDGLPFETLDKNYLLHKKDSFNVALKAAATSEFAFWSHVVRRKRTSLPRGEHSNYFGKPLNDAWLKQYEEREMYVNELYFSVIRWRPKGVVNSGSHFLGSLFRKADKEAHRKYIRRCRKELGEVVGSFMNTFGEYNPHLLGVYENEQGGVLSEQLTFIHYLLNLVHQPVAIPFGDLSSYLPSRRLSFGSEIEIRGETPQATRFASMLSIKDYPNRTFPGIFNPLLSAKREFIMTHTFQITDQQTALSRLEMQQRKLIQAEDRALSLIGEIDEATDDLASKRLIFGDHHCTIMCHEKSIEELHRGVSEIDSIMRETGIVCKREDINKEPCFWSQLPGNDYIARKCGITSKNYAAFSAFHNVPLGKFTNNHWGECLTLLETTSHTPYYFNYHVKDNGNTIIFGSSGTGKTTFLLFTIAQSLKYGGQRFIFDKDNGCEIFVRACGGSYSIIKRGVPTGFNPFQLPYSEQNRAFLLFLLKLMVSKTLHRQVSNQESLVLDAVVKQNYELDPEHRRLYHLRRFITSASPELRSALESWCGDGPYAWVFDNVEDSISFGNELNAFEMGNILDDTLVRSTVSAYLFYRIEQTLNLGQRTIVAVDELWRYMEDEEFGARLNDWARTIRKQNGIFIGATQTPNELLQNSQGLAVFTQCETTIFFPNYKADQELYTEKLHFTQRQYELIKNTPKESRLFFLRHGSDNVMCKFDLSPVSQFIPILSSRKATVELARRLIEQHGSEPKQWVAHFIKEVRSQDV